MVQFRVDITDEAPRAQRDARSFLESDPVQHNVIMTLLAERSVRPEPGEYAIVRAGDEVVGVSFRSPLHFPASITPMPDAAVEPLVDAIAEWSSDVAGVIGVAATAARFAGRWAERLKTPACPVEAQRVYELVSLRPPTDVPGALRRATLDDIDLVVDWTEGFGRDTGMLMPPRDAIAFRLKLGIIWLWEDGEPVASAAHTPAMGGVTRIGLVYTPPEHRRRGYAAACTAAATQAALDEGADRAMLFTQLENPQSNAIYRRLGYEPVAEVLRYRFGP